MSVDLTPELLPVAMRLPLTFDAAALARDIDALPASAWVPHFNTQVYEGDWSGVAFRAPNGDPGRLYPDLTGRSRFEDTPALASCPAVRDVLAAFPCALSAVRFLRLGPRSRIREHRDFDLGFRHGEVRLHVAITTHADVDFVVGGEHVVMQPGELWYADFEQPHRVENRGAHPRVHLVLDCVVDPFVEALLTRALEEPQRDARSAS